MISFPLSSTFEKHTLNYTLTHTYTRTYTHTHLHTNTSHRTWHTLSTVHPQRHLSLSAGSAQPTAFPPSGNPTKESQTVPPRDISASSSSSHTQSLTTSASHTPSSRDLSASSSHFSAPREPPPRFSHAAALVPGNRLLIFGGREREREREKERGGGKEKEREREKEEGGEEFGCSNDVWYLLLSRPSAPPPIQFKRSSATKLEVEERERGRERESVCVRE